MKFFQKIFFTFLAWTILSGFSFEIYSQNPLKKLDFIKPGQKSQSLRFKFINNLIIIPVRINNSDTLNFILDTGITTTMITELSYKDSLDLNFAREIKLQGLGVGEPLKGLHSYGNEINIGNIRGQNQDIYVILDNGFHLSERMGMQINGILGFSVFSNFIVSVNYDTKFITFYKPEGFNTKKRDKKYQSLPLVFNNTKPYIIINVTDNSGHSFPVKLLIDTGASHAIWLDYQTIPGFEMPEGSKQTYLGTGLNGEVYGTLGRFNKLEVAGSILDNVIVSFPDSASISGATFLNDRNGSVGSEILKRFNIIIDYPNEKISLKPNNAFKDEFSQNLSGMEIIAPIPGVRFYTVDGIRKDSPADIAGIQKGDILININGSKTDSYELTEIYQILQTQPDKKISISVLRNGVYINTSFRLERLI